MARSELVAGRSRRRAAALTLPLWTLVPATAVFLLGGSGACRGDGEGSSAGESIIRWEYFQEIQIPRKGDSPWVDVVLNPDVFDAARRDLGDLRLFDRSGRDIPYALRVRREVHVVESHEFDRAWGPDRSSELALDLGTVAAEHNQVEVEMQGVNFRRRAVLEASDDGAEWRQLAEKNLIRFQVGEKKIEDCSFDYPPSRFRYLRIRVFPDPDVDNKPDERPVNVGKVSVRRRIEGSGEMFTAPAALGAREPVKADGGYGSAWIIDLGANNVPCEQIEVDVADAEFVRDYRVEAAGPPDSRERFRRVCSGVWQRRAGGPPSPMKATFQEVRASRLKLVVTDYGNPPLNIRSVKYGAPARQVVFARGEKPEGGVRLYYGDPKAEAPHYDFARNLPPQLDPPPVRAKLGAEERNPDFVPHPLPFTERWPWAIYVVLASVSVVLGAVIFNVAGTAIAVHDAAEAPSRDTEAPTSDSPFGNGDETQQGDGGQP